MAQTIPEKGGPCEPPFFCQKFWPNFQVAKLKGTASAKTVPLGGKNRRFVESFAQYEDATPARLLLNCLWVASVRDSGHVSHYFLVAFYEFR